jgi:hypothetical protein
MSIKIRKGYDDVMEERLSVGIEEWRMENGELLRRSLILHSPFFFREEIELRQSQSPSRSSASFSILHSLFSVLLIKLIVL